MNPARSCLCLVVRRNGEKLWLYCTTTFVGTSIIAAAYRKKFNIECCFYISLKNMSVSAKNNIKNNRGNRGKLL